MSDKEDIDSIEVYIDLAINTIRDRVKFGLDDLNASYARERRAKGVLISCKKEIKYLKQQNKILIEALEFIRDYSSTINVPYHIKKTLEKIKEIK